MMQLHRGSTHRYDENEVEEQFQGGRGSTGLVRVARFHGLEPETGDGRHADTLPARLPVRARCVGSARGMTSRLVRGTGSVNMAAENSAGTDESTIRACRCRRGQL